MTAGGTTGTGSRRGLLVGGGLLALVLLVAVFAGGSSGRISGPPLSRRAQGADGLRALVLLLESYRATTHEVGVEPPAGTSVAVLVEDRLDDASRDALRAWVEEGNTLVVLDSSSPLAASRRGSVRSTVARGKCDIPGIGANSIDVSVADGVDLPVAARYEVEPGDQSCFGDGTSAFVVSRPVGDGTIVSVGSPRPFVNSALGKAGNATLAVELLASADGSNVAFVEANAIGAGEKSLVDLISDRVFQALIELVIAFVLYALWRARRLGRPVSEVQPVAIAASGLVRAVGRLRLRSRSTVGAAEAIRIDTRRFLAQRYGLAAGTPVHVIAQVTADRTDLTTDQVLLAIDDRPILDEAALVALTRQIDKVRQEALSGGRTVRG